MAYTLNTSHPLYGNLIELIGVQSGALVSHKTARTFTKDAAASYGTGTYGEHFVSVKGGNYTPQGASFTPALSTDGTAHGLTIVYVVNNIDAASSHGGMLSGNSAGTYRIPSVGIDGTGKAQITAGMDSYSTSGTTTVLNSGAYSLASTRKAGAQTSTSATLYVNGALEATGGTGINEVTTGNTIDYIGGTPGQTAAGAKFVWIAYFDRELTTAEILSLHNSLGANNAFGLVQAAGNAAPTFPGPNIGNLSGTVGTALTSNNVASKFSDTDALTFSAVGTWPPGITVSSAGVISGTPTTAGTYASLKVRATDTAAQTVDSDTFSFTINASAHLVTVANSQQVNTASPAAIQQSGNGTITLPALKDWGTGNLKASETGVTIIINNATTGALVALLTGQTANASGVLPTLTGLISGTAYRVTTILADGSEGTWKYTAS